MKRAFLALCMVSFLGACTTIQDIISAPTPQNLDVYIAQLESGQSSINQSIASLVQNGYIKKNSSTAKTLAIILSGANAAVAQANKDFQAGDTQAALVAYNTAKAAYDSVQQEITILKSSPKP